MFVPAQGTVLDTRSGVGGVSGPVTAYTWYLLGNSAIYRFAPLSPGLPGDKSAAGYHY